MEQTPTQSAPSQSKIVKPRKKRIPKNKKVPRRMGHIHRGVSQSDIVWGQRWFTAVDHASGGEQGELLLENASPSSSSPCPDSSSSCPSPAPPTTTGDLPSLLPEYTFYSDAAPLQRLDVPMRAVHSTSPPVDRYIASSNQDIVPSPRHMHPSFPVDPTDTPSTSYDIFSIPFDSSGQNLPGGTPGSAFLFSSPSAADSLSCRPSGSVYQLPTYQNAASPISPSSPASSGGWTLSPHSLSHEVIEPGVPGYPQAPDPSSNISMLFASADTGYPTDQQLQRRPRTTYHPYRDHTMLGPAFPHTQRQVHPRTPRVGIPAYHLAPNQSPSLTQLSDHHHSSPPIRHPRQISPTARSHTFAVPPSSNSDVNAYPEFINSNTTYVPYNFPSQQYPSMSYGDRFDSNYPSA